MGEGLFDQGKAVEQGEDLPTDHPLAETKRKEWGKEEVCFDKNSRSLRKVERVQTLATSLLLSVMSLVKQRS